MKESVKNILNSKWLISIIAIVLLLVLINLIFPPAKLKSYSKEIYAKDGTLLSAYLTNDDKWRMRTNLEEVTPDLIKAIIEKEDKWFYWHLGVNPFSIVRAMFSNITGGERRSGASTITMQVVRMLDPAERTYLNKMIEMLRAFQLELFYSKDEILEMYLSMLPFGGNLEGVKSASYIYFNRPPGKLSLAQSIVLTIIPNDPNSMRLDRFTENALKQRNTWIKKFQKENVFHQQNLEDAYAEPLESNRYALPGLAPHFSNYISQNFSADQIQTSLDLQIQQTAEKLLNNYVGRVRLKGVSNGSIIIVDNKTSGVVSYCGSSDFNDNNSSGQVNGITAVRSPGSTLKPGLYAFAFDSGLLTPKMKLFDIPTDFSGYEPENYDLDFNGEVTVEFALMNSLNVPAVRLLQKIGFNPFINLLAKGGFQNISESRDQLGLSVILGGCGITLEQLTKFFTAFSREGKLYPLNYLRNNSVEANRADLFSNAASYLIANILSGNERPDFPNELLYSSKLPKIAWKTGTSYGKRDAWAVGFNPHYTIGVWMGNFDGRGSPHLSGAEMSVPLLFDLFNAIDYESQNEWFELPEELETRKVCSETGLLPSKYCNDTAEDYFIKNKSTVKICNRIREFYVDEKESVHYCTDCLPLDNYKKSVYPVLEPELTLWYQKNNIVFSKIPWHSPDCAEKFTNKGPQIISPSQDFEYFIEKESGQEILLQAASDPTVQTHYWYVNDKYFNKCNPGDKIFFKPLGGDVKITCLDDKGRDMSIFLKMRTF